MALACDVAKLFGDRHRLADVARVELDYDGELIGLATPPLFEQNEEASGRIAERTDPLRSCGGWETRAVGLDVGPVHVPMSIDALGRDATFGDHGVNRDARHPEEPGRFNRGEKAFFHVPIFAVTRDVRADGPTGNLFRIRAFQ